MMDHTVLKPNPGGRKIARQASQNKSKEPQEDGTVIAPSSSVERSFTKVSQGVLISDNPVVEEAGDLFSLMGPIRCTTSHPDVSSLKSQCIELIKNYEQRLKQREVNPELIKNACYCLCSFIDEAVLNTSWGSESDWSSYSLLSSFFRETFGGEYFFTLLDGALSNPRVNIQLIELMYLCLSFGFVGKMRLTDHGYEKLTQVKDTVYRTIRSEKGEVPGELSVDWHSSVVAADKTKEDFPLWVILSLVGVLLLSSYMYLSYQINRKSDRINMELASLVQAPENTNVSVAVKGKVEEAATRLKVLLHTEIERGLLDVHEMRDRVRISLENDQLFSSGSANITEGFLPIVHKIAHSLEATEGRILVNGYTDDLPIFSTRYPSNWHLSLARANATADALSVGGNLRGRLWPEGRGEADPIAPNDTAENRARNRRVEIELIPN